MNSPADWSAVLAPSLDDFAALADQAYAALPDEFRKMVGDVVFQVAEFADEDVLEELGIEDAFELTGLYQGVSLAHRSLFDPSPSAAMVFLYRRPILDEWAERGDLPLGELIGHVLVHEIGHHFGLSDDDIHAIEAG
jgi:predicted Zn-dependent protease with MMP-like domain